MKRKIYFNDYLLIEDENNLYHVTEFSEDNLSYYYERIGSHNVRFKVDWYYIGYFYCNSSRKDYIIRRAKKYIKEVS